MTLAKSGIVKLAALSEVVYSRKSLHQVTDISHAEAFRVDDLARKGWNAEEAKEIIARSRPEGCDRNDVRAPLAV